MTSKRVIAEMSRCQLIQALNDAEIEIKELREKMTLKVKFLNLGEKKI